MVNNLVDRKSTWTCLIFFHPIFADLGAMKKLSDTCQRHFKSKVLRGYLQQCLSKLFLAKYKVASLCTIYLCSVIKYEHNYFTSEHTKMLIKIIKFSYSLLPFCGLSYILPFEGHYCRPHIVRL